MTKMKVIEYIQKDLRKLKKERAALIPNPKNETLRSYLATRENTLKEILNLMNAKG